MAAKFSWESTFSGQSSSSTSHDDYAYSSKLFFFLQTFIYVHPSCGSNVFIVQFTVTWFCSCSSQGCKQCCDRRLPDKGAVIRPRCHRCVEQTMSEYGRGPLSLFWLSPVRSVFLHVLWTSDLPASRSCI